MSSVGGGQARFTSILADVHVALHVNFDFAKATLKPYSSTVIAQVGVLLKANASYKLTVEGHTGSIGGAETNQTPSKAKKNAALKFILISMKLEGAKCKAGFIPLNVLSTLAPGALAPLCWRG